MKIHALVMIPADTPAEEQVETASQQLYPFMYEENELDKEFKFDYLVELDDYEDEVGTFIWSMAELLTQFETLEIEAIVTPDGE